MSQTLIVDYSKENLHLHLNVKGQLSNERYRHLMSIDSGVHSLVSVIVVACFGQQFTEMIDRSIILTRR